MLSAALEGTGVAPAYTMMVGDRLATDIRMAVDTGAASCLVTTGENTAADAAALPRLDRPTFVLDRVDHLIPAAEREELGWSDDDD
jgi:ribonucleotide monophosphatase NagD (HAD superfamily)